MDLARKTLIDIADVSRRVGNSLDQQIGHKTSEGAQLAKIVVGSRSILEVINETFLLRNGSADNRLVDWLNTEEPGACLRTLSQMDKVLNKRTEHGVWSIFMSLQSTHTQNKVEEAVRLFQTHKGYFHFLLTADIWNREGGNQRPSLATQSDIPHINQASDNRILAAPIRSKNDTDRVSKARKMSTTKEEKEAKLEMKLDDVLGWLNAWNSRETHERTVLLRQPDTCTWLPKTHAYGEWKNARNSILWLRGKPGAGKSVMAAYVIEDLKNALQDGEVVAYFYCSFREERSTSTTEVLRSLLSQLLQQFRHHSIDPGNLLDKLTEEKEGGASTIGNIMLLAHHISHAAEQFHKPPFLVIDALDECKNIEELLGALAVLRKCNIRLLVISRPLQIIKDEFSFLPLIDMDAVDEVSADIRLHIKRELDSHRRLRIVDAGLKNEIYFTLCWKADGMFRWVQCQLITLKRCMTKVDFQKALNNLPSDLDETYGRILLEIDGTEGYGQVARGALDWLVVALEPLQLSQIMEGLSVDVKQRVLDHDSALVHGANLLDALGSLVIYNEKTDFIILSHFSVKEYLIAESTRKKYPGYHIDQRVAHTALASTCFYYLCAVLRHYQKSDSSGLSLRKPYKPRTYCDNTNTTTSRSGKRPESYPLLRYVFSVGFRHLEHANPRDRALLGAIGDFQLDLGQHRSVWERLHKRTCGFVPARVSAHDTVLYILIAYAPEPLFCSFVDRTGLWRKDGTNPLVHAACLHKIEHAKALLSRGANVNHKGLNVEDGARVSPLEAAVRVHDHQQVDLFLDAGSHVPHRLFMHALQPYSLISRHILSTLLKTDDFVEWAAENEAESLLLVALHHWRYRIRFNSEEDTNMLQWRLIQIGYYPPAQIREASLHRAVSAGHVSIAKHMLTRNVSFPPNILLDALQSIHSSSEMIRLIVHAGCKVDIATLMGDTPIHLVLKSDHPIYDRLECVRMFVDAGCNPSSYNSAGKTPLHLAARFGYVSIVEYLLSLRISVPPEVFAEAHQKVVFRLLIRQWASVRTAANDGNTPLHFILARSWHMTSWIELVEYTRMLTNVGCDSSLPNALGKTPLDLAAIHAHLPVVQYLLSIDVPPSSSALLHAVQNYSSTATAVVRLLIDKGADIHVTTSDFFRDTLLHIAFSADSEVECLKRIKILIGAGCNPRACNSDCLTPFHFAAAGGYILVMEYLLSLGISLPTFIFPFSILRGCLSATRFLLDKGGDVHVTSDSKHTVLHYAAELEKEGDALEFVRLFADAGCNPSLANLEHEIPLHIAARMGHISVVRYFLSLGISIPHDILLTASTTCRANAHMTRYLIEEGANVSAIATDGNTPLHRLLLTEDDEDGCLECVKTLIDAGCGLRARNKAGITPLHAAALHKSIPILECLLAQGIPLPDDILRISGPRTICFLSKKGVDLRCVEANIDMRPVHAALKHSKQEADCLESIKILVGAAWDASSKDSAGDTPFHLAMKCGYISVVEYLLSEGVPLPPDILLVVVSSNGESDDIAALIRFFIDEGASVSATASSQDTPLHLALQHWFTNVDNMEAQWEAIKVLLDGGADPTARNVDGQTPLDIAEAKGHYFKENLLRLIQVS